MMTRILVLGGTGMTGRAVLRYLAAELPDAEVTCAARHPNERVPQRWVRFDLASPAEQIEPVLAGYDWVVACIGPYEKLRARIHGHCIRAGVGCIDVNDSIDARRDIVALDEQARHAEVPILTGFGLCPGISTILLDELAASTDPAHPTRDIEVRLLVGGKQEPGAASLESMFATLTSPWRALEGGVERLMPASIERLPDDARCDYLVGYECPDIDRVRDIAPGLQGYRYRAWFGQLGADDAERMQTMRMLRIGWLAPRLARLAARIGARRIERLQPTPDDTRVIAIATDDVGRSTMTQATGAPSFQLTGTCAGATVAAAVSGEFTPEAGVHEVCDLPHARVALRKRLVDAGVIISEIEPFECRGRPRTRESDHGKGNNE